ncbi:MAG TPA: GNAT family N-acetyltransferase [Tepidisphaeraceae bacterium]|nr:GNAT family N-acetyltransferase [Tepidisphaeraceae bacterium]
MIAIRDYVASDAGACLGLFDGNTPGYFAADERALFEAFLRRDDHEFFVAEDSGVVVGCGGFKVNEYGVGYLVWGIVSASRHGRGVGTALLRWRLERLRETPHAWCALLDTSQRTAGFFERFGFRAYRTVAEGYGAGLDKVYMRLTCSGDQTCD